MKATYQENLEYDRDQTHLLTLLDKEGVLFHDGKQQLQPVTRERVLIQQNLLKSEIETKQSRCACDNAELSCFLECCHTRMAHYGSHDTLHSHMTLSIIT